MPKVLVIGPDLSLPGGVANIYRSIGYDSVEDVEYFEATTGKGSFKPFFVPLMIFRFICKVWNFQIVHVNPSLDFKSIVRDGFLIFISKLAKRKVVVFFHGWQDTFEQKIQSQPVYKGLFSHIFNKVDIFCLLGSAFLTKLKSLGVSAKNIVYLPTVADDFYYKSQPFTVKDRQNDVVTILFLSRFDKNKGADIVIKTFSELQKKTAAKKFRLIMAGDGPMLESAKRLANDEQIDEIVFEGFAEGEKKHQILRSADILFLPSLSEGLPCVIMEGMLYGLAIVSRPVGGIPEWVKQNENGWLSDSTDPKIFAEGISALVDEPGLLISISERNIRIAVDAFTPEKFRTQLQMVYNQLN
jgi:glycosyltransferase involved in cell wall biosynthesis